MNFGTALKWAPFVSATASAVALLFAGVQMRHARRVAALQALQEFYKTILERERALSSATTPDTKKYAFREYVDCLELYAAAYNDRLVRGVANEIVRDKLLDVIVILQNTPALHADIEEAINSEAVYSHLYKFIRQNRKTVAIRSANRARIANEKVVT